MENRSGSSGRRGGFGSRGSRWPDGQRGARAPGSAPTRSYIESSEYLRGGYLDESGNLRPEVIITQAQQVVKELTERDSGLKYAQLRRFFTRMRNIESLLAAGHGFDSVKAKIASLEAAAADAVNRRVAPRVFEVLMKENVRLALQGPRQFEAMVDHFESIVCYYPRQSGE